MLCLRMSSHPPGRWRSIMLPGSDVLNRAVSHYWHLTLVCAFACFG